MHAERWREKRTERRAPEGKGTGGWSMFLGKLVYNRTSIVTQARLARERIKHGIFGGTNANRERSGWQPAAVGVRRYFTSRFAAYGNRTTLERAAKLPSKTSRKRKPLCTQRREYRRPGRRTASGSGERRALKRVKRNSILGTPRITPARMHIAAPVSRERIDCETSRKPLIANNIS